MQALFPTCQEIVLAIDTPQKESDSFKVSVCSSANKGNKKFVGFRTSYISSSVQCSQLRGAAALHTLTSTVPPSHIKHNGNDAP